MIFPGSLTLSSPLAPSSRASVGPHSLLLEDSVLSWPFYKRFWLSSDCFLKLWDILTWVGVSGKELQIYQYCWLPGCSVQHFTHTDSFNPQKALGVGMVIVSILQVRSRGRELFHKRWEVSSGSRWHLGLNVGLLVPWLWLLTSLRCVSQINNSVGTQMRLWKVGLWHDGIWTDRAWSWRSWTWVLSVSVSLHSIQCGFLQCLSLFNLLIFFPSFSRIALTSGVASVSGHIWNSSGPQKVSVSPRHPLTPAQAACRGQRESSYFRAHAAAFCSRGAEVPENTRCLGFLIGGTVGLEGKTRVGEYKRLFFTL